VWGNGTFTSPAAYAIVLNHWASHGFVVIAANTSNAGTSNEMRACLDYVLGENGVAGSPYEGKVDATRVGTSGHSQGGGGALMLGRDPRVTVSVPLQPFTVGLGHNAASQSDQHGPMLLLSGTGDTWAAPGPNQQPVFNNANVPVFWANKEGADHLADGTNGIPKYRAAATAWFRLHLMGDESARSMFYGPACTLCTDPSWIIQKKDID
jgi:hypothetical protein